MLPLGSSRGNLDRSSSGHSSAFRLMYCVGYATEHEHKQREKLVFYFFRLPPVTAPTIDKPGSADRTAYHFLSFLTLRWLLAQLCDYWTWSLESRIPKGWLSAHSLVRKQTETRLPFYFLNHNLLRQPRTSTLQVAELAILFAFAVSHPREVQAMVHRSCRSARLQSFHRTSIHRSMQRPAGAVSIIAVGPLR